MDYLSKTLVVCMCVVGLRFGSLGHTKEVGIKINARGRNKVNAINARGRNKLNMIK